MTISLCFSKIKIKTQQLCPFPHIMMQLLKKTRKNNKACCKQFVIGTIFSVTFNHWWEGAWRFLLHSDICGWCLVPPWNCLHQGLWAVFFFVFFYPSNTFCRNIAAESFKCSVSALCAPQGNCNVLPLYSREGWLFYSWCISNAF